MVKCLASFSLETQRQENTIKHPWKWLCYGYKRKPQVLIGKDKQAFHLILAAGSRDLALVTLPVLQAFEYKDICFCL